MELKEVNDRTAIEASALIESCKTKSGKPTGFIIDESAHLKKGKESVGVARHSFGGSTISALFLFVLPIRNKEIPRNKCNIRGCICVLLSLLPNDFYARKLFGSNHLLLQCKVSSGFYWSLYKHNLFYAYIQCVIF